MVNSPSSGLGFNLYSNYNTTNYNTGTGEGNYNQSTAESNDEQSSDSLELSSKNQDNFLSNFNFVGELTNDDIDNKTAEELLDGGYYAAENQADYLNSISSEILDGYTLSDDGTHFCKDDGNGNKEFLKVIVSDNEGETPKLVHTSLKAGETEAQTQLYEMNNIKNVADFDNWLNENTSLDETFQLFEFGTDYSNNLKEFSQNYINMLDSDNDGELSIDEYSALISGDKNAADDLKISYNTYNQMINEEQLKINNYDFDSDGFLNETEFENMMNNLTQIESDWSKEFEQSNNNINSDGDNSKISAEELLLAQDLSTDNEVYKLSKEYDELRNTFQILSDTDGDGNTLSAQDFATALCLSDMDENGFADGNISLGSLLSAVDYSDELKTIHNTLYNNE